jgi:hypothetical protein
MRSISAASSFVSFRIGAIRVPGRRACVDLPEAIPEHRDAVLVRGGAELQHVLHRGLLIRAERLSSLSTRPTTCPRCVSSRMRVTDCWPPMSRAVRPV